MRVKRALYYTLYCIYIFFSQIAPFMNGAICLLIKDAFARALLCVRPCCLLDLPISHAHDHMMMMMRALYYALLHLYSTSFLDKLAPIMNGAICLKKM